MRARVGSGLVAVVTAAAALAGCSGGPAGSGDASSYAALPVADAGCPAKDAPRLPTRVDDVPLGAVGLRLCGGPSFPVQAVPELLTTGLDEVAALVNDLPRDESTSCEDKGGVDYVLVLTYPGGRVQHAEGGLGACGTILVGGEPREDAARVLDDVVQRFADQRERSGPPAGRDLRAPGCPRYVFPGPPPSLLADSDEMTRAVLCVSLDPNASRIVARVPVSPADLRVLLDDLAAGVRSDEPCRGVDPRLLLVGRTAWGDVVTERMYCSGFQDDRYGSYVALGPRGRAVVARATRLALARR